MAKGLEIERKFLVDLPDLNKLDIERKIEIKQTYLKRGNNDSQRRVRKITENDRISYTYTEKVFVSPVIREENEYEITADEYVRLLEQLDESCTPVEKTRYCFNYSDQLFELDVYPFSHDLAIMELELDFPEQKIYFPECVNVLKDVSDDKRYSNASLALAASFPTEAGSVQ